MSDTVDEVWLRSAKKTIQGMNVIFTTCPMVPEVLDVVIRAMWAVCELTSAPLHVKAAAPAEVQIAARSLLVNGTWRPQEQAVYEVLLRLTGEPPAFSLPPLST